jgi:lantibiotic transport system ATP-binding protein
MASNALETFGLAHRFETAKALDGVDLEVEQGSIYGFLGPNGAGKTTAIRCILGLLRASGGRVEIFGESHPVRRRQGVGALVETPAFYDHLSARRNLELSWQVCGSGENNISETLSMVGLSERAGDPVRSHSLGMRQRLGIARALLGRPRLLILDEPTNGMDPRWRKEIRDILVDQARERGTTVFLSTHLLSEVESCCQQVGILDQGRLLYQGAVSGLRDGSQRFLVEAEDMESLRTALEGIPLVSELEETEEGLHLQLKEWDASKLNSHLHGKGIPLRALVPIKRSLEEAFLRLTEGEAP